MVEGLTTSAPDPGSGTESNREIGSHDNTTRSLISDFSAPALDTSSAQDAADHIQQQDPGDASGEAIPVPIPNTEVKLSSAEDTERAAFRENRSSPGSCAFRRFPSQLATIGYASPAMTRADASRPGADPAARAIRAPRTTDQLGEPPAAPRLPVPPVRRWRLAPRSARRASTAARRSARRRRSRPRSSRACA